EDLLETKELAVLGAKNELVFQCKRTQFEPKNGAKKPLLTRNRSQNSRVGRWGGWASTRGLHELRIRPLRAMEIRPAQCLADSGKELQGFFLRQNGVLRMTRDPRLRYSREVESREVEESRSPEVEGRSVLNSSTFDSRLLDFSTSNTMAVTDKNKKAPLEAVFGPGGWLARRHPNYEHRPGQLEMAESVEAASENRRHLIVEAGTGTGKTLAYLVPIMRSGRRVVISTGTKNLQEQLFFKDIPFLRKLFPDIRVALMKGRQNYLCRQKLYDIEKQPVLNGLEEVAQYPKLKDWDAKTESGDRAELSWLPDSSELWAKVDARRETCTGQKCPQFERCFITLMHQRAAASDLIIVNHHLFFADLALRGTEVASLLPDYEALVFDEAHDIEDVATQYFGLQVSNYRVEELARDTESTLKAKGLKSAEVLQAVAELRRRSDLFFELFPSAETRSNFDNRESFLKVHGGAYSSLLNAMLRPSCGSGYSGAWTR